MKSKGSSKTICLWAFFSIADPILSNIHIAWKSNVYPTMYTIHIWWLKEDVYSTYTANTKPLLKASFYVDIVIKSDLKWKGQNYIQKYIISKKFRKQFYFVFGWLLCWYCYKAWFEKKRTKLYSKVLLVKSLGNNFILLPVIYLFMWIMKASKNFGKISIRKIWQLISL